MSVSAAPTPSQLVAARGTPLNQQHILLGYKAFNQGSYEEAMMYFQLTEADPLQIMSLFPDVLPSQLLHQQQRQKKNRGDRAEDGEEGEQEEGEEQDQDEEDGGSEDGDDDDDAASSSSFPPSSPFSRLRLPPHPVPVEKVQGEEKLFRALSALIPYLAQIQNRLRLSLEPMFAGAKEEGKGGGKKQTQQQQTPSPEGDDPALSSIRTKRRTLLSPPSSTAAPSPPTSSADSNLALAILVDTALLKAYLLCDIPLGPFLASPYNLCDVDECAHILQAYEKWTELIAFYKFRARHQQALELLAHLGQMAPSSADHASSGAASSLAGLSGTEATIKYLQELAINIHQPCYPLQNQEEEGMGETSETNSTFFPSASPSTTNGSTSTSSTSLPSQFSPASSLDPNPDAVISLILHYSQWPLMVNVDEGLKIFTFCHTMNARPVDGKGVGKAGLTASTSSPLLSALSSTSSTLIHSPAHHASHCIPSHLVLDHLKKHVDRETCIQYLESLIGHVGETGAVFHNELIFMYLEGIQKIMRAREQRQIKQQAAAAAAGSEPERLDSVAEIAVRPRGGASNKDGTISTRDSLRLQQLRRKLLDFLRSSPHYTAEKMLSRFPRHTLLEERAILLARINQHKAALNIYAHKLHDPLQAEAYAEEFYNAAMQALAQQQQGGSALAGLSSPAPSSTPPSVSSPSASSSSPSFSPTHSVVGISSSLSGPALIAEGRNMYLTLLQVYLQPPPPEVDERAIIKGATGEGANMQTVEPPAPMLDAALSLLTRYFDRIPPVAALESLPAETPLQALCPYFEKLLCHTKHQLRDEQITKQLLKAEFYATKESFLSASRGRVLCDHNTTCAKCGKKLGNSAFARYPAGQIVHYVCHQLSLQAQSQTMKGDL